MYPPREALGRGAILALKRALRDDGCVDLGALSFELRRAVLGRRMCDPMDGRLLGRGWRVVQTSDRAASNVNRAAQLTLVHYNSDPEAKLVRARARAQRYRARNAPMPWQELMHEHLTITINEGVCKFPFDGEPTTATVQQWALRACRAGILLQYDARTDELYGPRLADGTVRREAVRYHLALWKLVARGCAYAKLAERRGDVVSVHVHAIPAAQVAKMPQAPFMTRLP